MRRFFFIFAIAAIALAVGSAMVGDSPTVAAQDVERHVLFETFGRSA